jgi:hypothetical protein
VTSRDFCYWLQGLFELTEVDANKKHMSETLSIQQVAAIKRHLAMVFKHEIDPSFGNATMQNELTVIHEGAVSNPNDFKIKC